MHDVRQQGAAQHRHGHAGQLTPQHLPALETVHALVDLRLHGGRALAQRFAPHLGDQKGAHMVAPQQPGLVTGLLRVVAPKVDRLAHHRPRLGVVGRIGQEGLAQRQRDKAVDAEVQDARHAAQILGVDLHRVVAQHVGTEVGMALRCGLLDVQALEQLGFARTVLERAPQLDGPLQHRRRRQRPKVRGRLQRLHGDARPAIEPRQQVGQELQGRAPVKQDVVHRQEQRGRGGMRHEAEAAQQAVLERHHVVEDLVVQALQRGRITRVHMRVFAPGHVEQLVGGLVVRQDAHAVRVQTRLDHPAKARPCADQFPQHGTQPGWLDGLVELHHVGDHHRARQPFDGDVGMLGVVQGQRGRGQG